MASPGSRHNEVIGHADTLILGAGPAGLAAGYELQQRGLRFLILERGPGVGDSWRRMPEALKLVSPWKANALPGTARGYRPRHYQISRIEFLAYLEAYARTHQLPVRTNVHIERVEKASADGFQVVTSDGVFTARFVVNATGCFASPFIPALPGAETSRIPQIHVAEYRSVDQLRARAGRAELTVLIVGQRLSAGQTMVELVEAGCTVLISHRSPLRFGVGPAAWWWFYRLFPWLEWLQLKLPGARTRPKPVLMPGGRARELIASGQVRTVPAIRRFEPEEVELTDGERLRVDLVIYATGFHAALQHLARLNLAPDAVTGLPALRDLESATVPGLFFLGLDHARNFQSRFLRGIRRDAGFLADCLQRRLSSSSQSPVDGTR